MSLIQNSFTPTSQFLSDEDAYLRHLTHLSKALWPFYSDAEPIITESLTTIALQKDAMGRFDAHWWRPFLKALLVRARHIPSSQIQHASEFNPFYRLTSSERFVLAALHLHTFSYAELISVLEMRDTLAFQDFLWQSRLRLVQDPYPAGPTVFGPHCPEYNLNAPWTQRLLDEELSGTEKLFFQTHLNSCSSCRNALDRCRRFYYAVDECIPTPAPEEVVQQIRSYKSIIEKTWIFKHPSERTGLQSLRVFMRRGDIQWIVGILAIWTVVRLLQLLFF